MSGKNLASALQNFRQLAAKNQRIKVKSAEQWAKVREEERQERRRRETEREKRVSFIGKETVFWPRFPTRFLPASLPPHASKHG